MNTTIFDILKDSISGAIGGVVGSAVIGAGNYLSTILKKELYFFTFAFVKK